VKTLPRRLAIAVAIAALLLSACRDTGSDAAASASPSQPPAPPTVTPPSPTVGPDVSSPAPAGRARCTLVLGMSVTANWFIDGEFETLPGIDDARWELIWESGHDLILYADPDALPYSGTPISPCGLDPDRVLFQIAARDWQDPDAVLTELRASIDNIRAAWPSVDTVELIPIVGGPGSGPCYDPDVPDKGVLASFMNPPMVDAIAEIADGTDVIAGPNLLLADCAQFRDGTGHLTPEGSAFVAAALAEHYGS
jgi:hypothetical protein